jgi:hypothetical protein
MIGYIIYNKMVLIVGFVYLKESLEKIGFDLSKPYDELIKESYITSVIFSNIDNDKYARFGFLCIYLSLIKVVPKGLNIYTYYKPTNDDLPVVCSSVYDVQGFPIFRTMLGALQACDLFRSEIENNEICSYINIEHIYNCMRMLLTLYYFYDDIPE